MTGGRVVDVQLRDWYLAVLGVTPYRRRTPQGNERESGGNNALDFAGSAVGKLAAQAPSEEDSESGAPLAAITVAEKFTATVKEARRPAADEGVEVPDVAAPAESAAVYCSRIACWQPVADVLVLGACAPGQIPESSELVLLANILRAIKRLPGDLPVAEFLDWPPTAGAAGDITGARINLAMFLAGRARVRPFQWVLAMGDALTELLAPTRDLSQNRALLECGATVIFTPGLAAMAADPACKAVTWAAIRFLENG